MIVVSNKNITFENVHVNQRVFNLDQVSGVLSENYKVGDRTVSNTIGVFNSSGDYRPLISDDFLQRRSNFHGLSMRLVSAQQKPNLFLRDQARP